VNEQNPTAAPAPAPAVQAAVWAASCEALDASSATERLAALQDAVEATVHDLDRAGLLPDDYEYVPDTNVGELRILTGNLQLRAGMTGSLDTPAAHFLVTTSDDDDEQAATERTTTDLGAVRAWIMRWSLTELAARAAQVQRVSALLEDLRESSVDPAATGNPVDEAAFLAFVVGRLDKALAGSEGGL
jgi:hypothetical protein